MHQHLFLLTLFYKLRSPNSTSKICVAVNIKQEQRVAGSTWETIKKPKSHVVMCYGCHPFPIYEVSFVLELQGLGSETWVLKESIAPMNDLATGVPRWQRLAMNVLKSFKICIPETILQNGIEYSFRSIEKVLKYSSILKNLTEDSIIILKYSFSNSLIM